jgi:hypothetical protein
MFSPINSIPPVIQKGPFFETVTIGFRCSEGFLYSTPSMEKLSAPEGHFYTVLIICLGKRDVTFFQKYSSFSLLV